MHWFRDFSTPLWEIFGGNLLLLVTLAFYIAWWVALFGPRGDSQSGSAGFLIAAAFFAGLASIALLLKGIDSLSGAGQGFPVTYILAGAAAFYFVSFAVTVLAFRRILTSELLLITVWAALELSVIAVLQGSGRFGPYQVWTLIALVGLATVVGMVAYVQHYRLDEAARFWNGLVPLLVDAGVVAACLAALAFS